MNRRAVRRTGHRVQPRTTTNGLSGLRNNSTTKLCFFLSTIYAEGPPTDPSMTIERLLRPDAKLQEEFEGTKATIEESATALPAGGNEFVLPRVASKG